MKWARPHGRSPRKGKAFLTLLQNSIIQVQPLDTGYWLLVKSNLRLIQGPLKQTVATVENVTSPYSPTLDSKRYHCSSDPKIHMPNLQLHHIS